MIIIIHILTPDLTLISGNEVLKIKKERDNFFNNFHGPLSQYYNKFYYLSSRLLQELYQRFVEVAPSRAVWVHNNHST